MNTVQSELCRLLSCINSNSSYLCSVDNDLIKKLYRESYKQTVFLLFKDKYKEFSKEDLYNGLVVNNMLVNYGHNTIHELLTKHNYPYVILKGVASASYYEKPILRMMGDVDFLVKEEDFLNIHNLLLDNGFILDKTGSLHYAYRKDGVTYEMHKDINGLNKDNKFLNDCLKDIIEKRVLYKYDEGQCFIPDDFHHGLILLVHSASHLSKEGMGLRHLFDLAVFFNHFSKEEFELLFEDKLKACGLYKLCMVLGRICIDYLGSSEKDFVCDEVNEKLLLEDILNSGNFGNKDTDRFRQIKYIYNRDDYTVDNSNTLKQLFKTIKVKSKTENKSEIAVIIDYIKMLIKGERHIDTFSTVKKARERKKLYASLNLYQKEND